MSTISKLLFFGFVLISLSSQALSTVGPLVPVFEKAGLQRLNRSEHKVDFQGLATHFRAQTDKMVCGPTTATIVLNALRFNTPKAPRIEIPAAFLEQMPYTDDKKTTHYDPRLNAYTPEAFLNEAALKIKSLSRLYAEPIDEKRDPGLQLEQFRQMLETHNLNVTKLVVGNEKTPAGTKFPAVVAQMKKNLAEKDNYVVVNYARAALGQKGGGHISPVAAYDKLSDSFLILDVNPATAPWVWVASQDLVNAMNTKDTVENRGVLLISEK